MGHRPRPALKSCATLLTLTLTLTLAFSCGPIRGGRPIWGGGPETGADVTAPFSATPPASTAPVPRTTGTLRVDFIAVGHGDAVLITSPTGKTVLIDGGFAQAGETVARFVGAQTRRPLDLVLLTHRHADHLGGLAKVIARQGARLFMDAAFPHPSPAYDALIGVLEERRIPIRVAERGRTVDLGGGARLILLTPPEPLITGSRSDVNANSVVARLDFGQSRFLLTGDAEAVTEDWLMRTHADIRADVLKLAHHGSRHSSGAAFLRTVAPRVAVASSGPPARTGHIHGETVRRVGTVGARLYRTDIDGNIAIFSDGKDISVQTQYPRSLASVASLEGSQ